MRSFTAVLASGLALGCSSSSFDVAGTEDDTGIVGGDTSIVDSSAADSRVGDGRPGDSSNADSAHPDSSTTDSSAVPDGSKPDSAVIEIGVDSTDPGDAPPVCPMPHTTKVADLKSFDCTSLAGAYADAVQSAMTCGCTADCSVEVCETFCCNCKGFVNPGSDAYAVLVEAQKEWTSKGCTSGGCPLFFCGEPTLTGCSSIGSAPKKCAVVRGVP